MQIFLKKAIDVLISTEKSSFSVYCIKDMDEIEKSEIADIFAQAAYTGIRKLYQAIELNSEEMIESALSKLIGLGRGLTPSMDDFLCGMLFVFHYCKNNLSYKLNFLAGLSSNAKKLALCNTNTYSAAYISAASEGEDFSLMRSCLESVAEKSFYDNVNSLLSVGSSSGADMLSGMCFAAKYILKQQGFTL